MKKFYVWSLWSLVRIRQGRHFKIFFFPKGHKIFLLDTKNKGRKGYRKPDFIFTWPYVGDGHFLISHKIQTNQSQFVMINGARFLKKS